LDHVTIVGNTAEDGGGIFGGVLEATNSIIATNEATGGITEDLHDPSAGLYTLTNNLIGNGFINSGTINDGTDDNIVISVAEGDVAEFVEIGVNPTLFDNGGPTETHALVENSLAIDAVVVTTLDIDQRGFARPFGDASDIGAFEEQTDSPPAFPNGLVFEFASVSNNVIDLSSDPSANALSLSYTDVLALTSDNTLEVLLDAMDSVNLEGVPEAFTFTGTLGLHDADGDGLADDAFREYSAGSAPTVTVTLSGIDLDDAALSSQINVET